MRTVEGYSPVMIAIMNSSNECLEKLCEYGGVDYSCVNTSKMTPWEIAMNFKNDTAISLIVKY